jgi:hypothetical protein
LAFVANDMDSVRVYCIEFVDGIPINIGKDNVVTRCDQQRGDKASAYVSSAEVKNFRLSHEGWHWGQEGQATIAH